MSDFIIKDGVLIKYMGKSGYVKLPDTVTSIGNLAFCCDAPFIKEYIDKRTSSPFSILDVFDEYERSRGFKVHDREPEEVPIFDGIESIGDDAYHIYFNITGLLVPNDLESVGENAFYHCSHLTDLTFCGSVKDISGNAFNNVPSLTSVVIAGDVGNIGKNAFKNCPNLRSIIIHGKLKNVNAFAFDECINLERIVVHGDIWRIGESAFKGCVGLKEVITYGSLHNIDYRAFIGCTGLTDIKVSKSIGHIDNDAFSGCTSLTTVTNTTPGNNPINIEVHAFDGCENLDSDTRRMIEKNIKGYKARHPGYMMVRVGNPHDKDKERLNEEQTAYDYFTSDGYNDNG